MNLVLLGYADSRDDPVGKLAPRVTIMQPVPPTATQTTEDADEETDEDERDD